MHAFILILFCFLSSFCNASIDWETHKQETIAYLPKLPGWCNQEKALMLMDFIYETKPIDCVEIGAFGGSTTYPIAKALQYLQNGTVFAIDAWENAACIEGLEPSNANIPWWSSVNLREIHLHFEYFISTTELKDYCVPLHMRSEDALPIFSDASIDFLYIDGNFSSQGCLRDVKQYFPKVKPGGYIWLNDADFPEKNKAVAFLMKHCTWLRDKSLGKQCVCFKKK